MSDLAADPIIEFVIQEPRERVEQLADELHSGRISLAATGSQLDYAFVHGPRSRQRMASVLAFWRANGGSEELLSRVLREQLEIRRVIEERGPRVELVWTGETPSGAGVRSTFPVIKEMLTWARRSVLVVTYSLWITTGEALEVVELIAELSSSGIDVTFILDRRYNDGWNLAQLWAKWPKDRRHPAVYSWQDEDDALAKLHAKVIVVDAQDVLISSANMTGHGIGGRNLEIGIRAKGKPAEDTAAHFDGLIRSGAFLPVTWGSR